MTNLNTLNLAFNPFADITPNIASTQLIWASMGEVKSKLERTYGDCINHNSKQIVLNWGPLGGGKTFSAFYFSKTMADADNLKHIYLVCPKDGAKATDEFFKNIIDEISFDTLRSHIGELINQNGEDELIRYLTPRATKEYAKAIALIGSENDDVSEMMNRFLFTGLTKNELKKLGLAKDIQTDNDSVKFLSGILSCFTGTEEINNGRVVIWLDEMEDLIYFTPKNYRSFSQSLRELFANIPDRFLFFMNFTLAEGEDSTIKLMLGEALWSRVTKKIRYKEFTEDDALDYVTTLLEAGRIVKGDNKPFSAEISINIINNIPLRDLTPREINKHITSLLSFVMEHDLNIINNDVLNDWVKDYAENS